MKEQSIHTHGGDVYRHKDVIDFSANINFRGMPRSVREAAQKAVEICGNYPDIYCEELKAALEVRTGVPRHQIICGNGAAELIFSLVLARKPKQALLTAPSFFEYEQALNSIGCAVQRCYLKEEEGFEVNERFVEMITPQTDMVFLCNPNNPTGVLVKQALLEQILQRCQTCDALLVLDECFYDFLENQDACSMQHCIAETKHLFILRAFTKMYAMAGLRLGYGFSSDQDLLADIQRVRQPWSVSIPAQMAGIAAANEAEFARESAKIIQTERKKLQAELQKKGYPVMDSRGNYLFFKGPEDLYERCLKQGFLLRDCSNYEGLTKGWYRIAVKCPEDNQKLLAVL